MGAGARTRASAARYAKIAVIQGQAEIPLYTCGQAQTGVSPRRALTPSKSQPLLCRKRLDQWCQMLFVVSCTPDRTAIDRLAYLIRTSG